MFPRYFSDMLPKRVGKTYIPDENAHQKKVGRFIFRCGWGGNKDRVWLEMYKIEESINTRVFAIPVSIDHPYLGDDGREKIKEYQEMFGLIEEIDLDVRKSIGSKEVEG